MFVMFTILLIRYPSSLNGSSGGVDNMTDAAPALAYPVSVNEGHQLDAKRKSRILTVLSSREQSFKRWTSGWRDSRQKESEFATTESAMVDALKRERRRKRSVRKKRSIRKRCEKHSEVDSHNLGLLHDAQRRLLRTWDIFKGAAAYNEIIPTRPQRTPEVALRYAVGLRPYRNAA